MPQHQRIYSEQSNRICHLLIEWHALKLNALPFIRAQEYAELREIRTKTDRIISEIREIQLDILSKESEKRSEDQLTKEFILSINKLIEGWSSPILRSYAVIPDKLYVGEIPSSTEDLILQQKIELLSQLGITKIINLTEEGETNFKGIPLRDYSHALTEKIEMKRMSIKDLDIPTKSEMSEILKVVREHLHSGERVYVHCWGGIGRTGTVLGCFLIEQGILEVEHAIPFIAFLKRNTTIRDIESPETPEQRKFILSWKD